MSNQSRWWFLPHIAGYKSAENTSAEHFNSLDTSGKAEAFVREAFQNSLDGAAEDGGMVRVRVHFSGEAEAKTPEEWLPRFGDLLDHIEACSELNIDVAALKKTNCSYMLVEDFGTTGLTGDVEAWDESDPLLSENHFYHFFRTVGRTAKSGQRMGSWGVGKFVFLMSSKIRSMIGYTVPLSGPEAGSSLVMGQSTIRFHSFNQVAYINDGYFGVPRGDDGFPLPAREETAVEVREFWGLERSDEPGLSIVVPFCDDVDPYEFLRATVREFCGSIIDGKIEVTVSCGDWDEDQVLTADTLGDFVDSYRNDPDHPGWSMICRFVDAISWYISRGRTPDLTVGSTKGAFTSGVWDPGALTEGERDFVRNSLDHNGRICVRVPLEVKLSGAPGDARASYFDVVLGTGPDLKGHQMYTEYFRNSLRISGRRMGTMLSGVESYLFADHDVIAQLLRSSEGPAHTEWSPAREKFAGRYAYGPQWLTFVKQAPRQLVKLLLGGDKERDIEALSDLFPRPASGSRSDGGKGKKKETDEGGGITPPPPDEIPEGVDPGILLSPAEGDGFYVTVVDKGTVEIEMAFDVPRGSPFTKWHSADFTADKLLVTVVEGDVKLTARKDDNRVRFESRVEEISKVLVTGFSDARDLKVRAKWIEGAGS